MILGEILVPQACWCDSAKALNYLRRAGLSMKVDIAVQFVMDEQGAARLLQQMFMFEWSSRLRAKDALCSPFFNGRRARAGEPVDVACDVDCDVCKPPPPFVPEPWLPQWSEEHAAWYFWRTSKSGCCWSTFDVPPCVPPLWDCLLYTSPSPRDLSTSRMPSSA